MDKIRHYYYTSYKNLEQQIFASQYENLQLELITQQFQFTFEFPPLIKTGTKICPSSGQVFVPVLPVRAREYPKWLILFGSGFPIGVVVSLDFVLKRQKKAWFS